MPTDHLDALSSAELHDRALDRARRHLDIGFFVRLLQAMPAARAAHGDVEESFTDVLRPGKLIAEAVDQDPALVDNLRPLYLEYLREHGEE